MILLAEMLLDDPCYVARTPLVVKWEITKRCNLACMHCYASAGESAKSELTTREARHLLTRFDELNVLNIVFTGGEPFARSDLMSLLELCYDRSICVDVLTNGTLITEVVSEKLSQLAPHSIQVSIDGATPGTHDRLRGVKGAFDRTIEAIKYLVKAKVRTTISCTFHKGNIAELESIYHLVRQLGVQGLLFGFIYPIGRGGSVYNKWALSSREQEYVRSFLVKKSQELKGDLAFKIYVDEAVGRIEAGRFLPPACKAGRIMITIGANGDIIPCPMLFDMKAGNVRRDDVEAVWQRSSVLTYLRDIANIKGPCSGCPFLPKCGGGCRAMAYLVTGDAMGSDPRCPLLRSI